MRTIHKTASIVLCHSSAPNMKFSDIYWNAAWKQQADFTKGGSNTDQLNKLKQLLNPCKEYSVDVYRVFVDLRQSYESINRNKAFEIMKYFDITTKLLQLV
jgi:hypothetical protein